MPMPIEPLLAFTLAAALLTVTPGVDTALVLRTAAAEGPGAALRAGLGIGLGLCGWGLVVALGLGALLAAAPLAYDLLRWAGAAYLAWLGLRLLWRPRRAPSEEEPGGAGSAWLVRGFLTNMLNPKVGAFYISFLPQFLPPGADVPATMLLLTAIHATLTLLWFGALILATRPLGRLLRRGAVLLWLDRATGGVLLAFAARLALVR
jgi:threonine/homoserine/homoserine lactone efflux protein